MWVAVVEAEHAAEDGELLLDGGLPREHRGDGEVEREEGDVARVSEPEEEEGLAVVERLLDVLGELGLGRVGCGGGGEEW